MDTRPLLPAVLAAAVAFAGCSGGGGEGSAAAACSYALSPASALALAAGGTGSIAVSAGDGCPWTATASQPWLTVTAGTSGAGNGTVRYAVAANPASAERTGVVTVASRSFTITQAGSNCAYTLQPAVASFTAAAGSGTIGVSAPDGCAWTAATDAAWITVPPGASGTGAGTVSFSVAANGATASRQATIGIADRAFTVTQGGAGCTYAVAPATASVGPAAGSGSFSVTAPAACLWAAGSPASWLTFPGGAIGSGSAVVVYDVGANPDSVAREGTISVAGETHAVTQDAAVCIYALDPGMEAFRSPAASSTFAVVTPGGCPWEAASNDGWITVLAGSAGSGPGRVEFGVDENLGPVVRTGTLTAAGQTFTVVQGWGSEVDVIVE